MRLRRLSAHGPKRHLVRGRRFGRSWVESGHDAATANRSLLTLSNRLLRNDAAMQHGVSGWLVVSSTSIFKWFCDLGSSTLRLRSRHQDRESDQEFADTRSLSKPLELAQSMG